MTRLLLVLAFLLAGCRAEDLVKQGEVGEVCNGRDNDCRAGLICGASGRCEDAATDVTYDCGDICERLSVECEAAEPQCESDCRLTTNIWATRAREEFGVCLVEGLSCAEARADFAPQTCYSEIEIPAERFALCEDFALAVRDCGAPTADAERVLERCAAIARVAPEVRWLEPAGCGPLLETGNCGELTQCFNTELELEPALDTF